MTTTAQGQRASKSLLSKYLPILTWLPRYNRAWLRPDVAAIAAVLIAVALLFTLRPEPAAAFS